MTRLDEYRVQRRVVSPKKRLECLLQAARCDELALAYAHDVELRTLLERNAELLRSVAGDQLTASPRED